MKGHHWRIRCRCWRISWVKNCEYDHTRVTDIWWMMVEIQWCQHKRLPNPLCCPVREELKGLKMLENNLCVEIKATESTVALTEEKCAAMTQRIPELMELEAQEKDRVSRLVWIWPPSQFERTFLATDFKAKPSDRRGAKARWNIWSQAQRSARRRHQRCKWGQTANQPLWRILSEVHTDTAIVGPHESRRIDCTHANNVALQGVSVSAST